MSRIGKKPIEIPPEVKITIDSNNLVAVKGPKGELKRYIRPEVRVEKKENQIVLSADKENKRANAFWGLSRALVANMIEGVVSGFQKTLEIQGIGYKAGLEGEDLSLSVGFSHLVKYKKVEGIKFEVQKNNIIISGIDKELVGQVAAAIRKIRPPEPYKGKGIRYEGEYVRKKSGKKAVATE